MKNEKHLYGLFIVMLLGVFVGEGIRNAFDPKRRLHYE